MAAHAGAENNNSCLRLLRIHQPIQIERRVKGKGLYNSCIFITSIITTRERYIR
jgi:hypothetical protein